MASAASLPAVGDISTFIAEHSELYKARKAGDAAATVEACFPPVAMMPAERVVQCVSVLARLFTECVAAASRKERAQRIRIFRVRDSPLHASLEGFDNDEGLADLRTVLDYMLLPKPLVEALGLELAAVKARREYQAAIGGYNLLTATTPKPRLIDFLLLNDGLKSTLRAALKGSSTMLRDDRYGRTSDDNSLVSGLVDRGSRSDAPEFIQLQRGFLDGLMGESLSEYGYTPSEQRVLAYTSGCIVAGRPLPSSELLSSIDAEELLPPDEPFRALGTQLPELAAEAGNIKVLHELHETRGWGLHDRIETVFEAAAASNSRNTLLWLYDIEPDLWHRLTYDVFVHLVHAGHFDTARWAIEWLHVEVESVRISEAADTLTGSAAAHNDLEALRWLHEELEFPLHSDIPLHACKHGNREMLDWFFSDGDWGLDWWTWDELIEAFRCGHTEIGLSLLREHRPEGAPPIELLTAACQGSNGDAGIIDTLVAAEPQLAKISDIAQQGLRDGLTQLVEWAASKPGFEEWLQDPAKDEFLCTLERAVASGYVDLALWLLNRAGPERLAKMAEGPAGKPKLRFAPASSATAAALLDFLSRYYDCSSFYISAMQSLDGDLARRLNGVGCKVPLPDPFFRFPYAQARPQWLPFVRLLVNECGLDLRSLPYASQLVARSGSAEVAAFFLERGVPLSSETLLIAARYGQLPLCRWLRQQGVEWPADIEDKARDAGAEDVAAWIEEEQANEKKKAASKAGGGRQKSPPAAAVGAASAGTGTA